MPKRRYTKRDLERLRAARARKDLVAFGEYVLRDMSGEPIEAAPHQRAWAEHIFYSIGVGKDPVILAPMSYGKTNWISIAAPLFFLGLNENFRIMIVSSADDIASKRLTTIGRYIEESVAYNEVFPWVARDRSRDWNKTYLNVQRKGASGAVDASVSAYGVGTSGIGSRCDILIFDDVADEKNSVRSPANREAMKSLVKLQWMSRPDPVPLVDRWGRVLSRGPIVLTVGTRYAEEDIYDDFMKAPERYCTMVQGVSETFDTLDVRIIGGCREPVHPVQARYLARAA